MKRGFLMVALVAIGIAAVMFGRKMAADRREAAFREELEELPAPSM